MGLALLSGTVVEPVQIRSEDLAAPRPEDPVGEKLEDRVEDG
ncbi:hypothetical protein [Crossiella sp. CA198]